MVQSSGRLLFFLSLAMNVIVKKMTLRTHFFLSSDKMDVATEQSKYNSRTLRDAHGQYPAWMNQRAIQKRKTSSKLKGKVSQKRKTKAVKR